MPPPPTHHTTTIATAITTTTTFSSSLSRLQADSKPLQPLIRFASKAMACLAAAAVALLAALAHVRHTMAAVRPLPHLIMVGAAADIVIWYFLPWLSARSTPVHPSAIILTWVDASVDIPMVSSVVHPLQLS